MARIAIIALLLLAASPALAEPAQPDAPPADAGATPPHPAAAAPAEQNAATPPAATPPPSDANLREFGVPDDRVVGAGAQPAARVLRAGDLAGEPVPARRGRPAARAAASAPRASPSSCRGTAAERGLLDPFDPVQALPKSAEFLRELRDQFGNLGLAAAAYNAGPQRVRDWLAGRRDLPAETRNYVQAITGHLGRGVGARAARRAGAAGAANCTQLMALLHRAPNPFVQQARGAGEHRGRQPVGRAAQRRVLARPGAVELRDAGASAMPSVLTGRDPSLLSSVFRSRGTRPFYQVRVGAERARRRTPCGHPPRRRRLHGAAQRRELLRSCGRRRRRRAAPAGRIEAKPGICTNIEGLLAIAAMTMTQRASCCIHPRIRAGAHHFSPCSRRPEHLP